MMRNSYFNPESRSRPNIVQVVGRYTALRKSGKEFKARCVFHDDTHPSLSINEDRGLFHCFGCQASGDVFTFVELAEGVNFRGALAFLGMDGGNRPPGRLFRRLNFSTAAWARAQVEKMNARLRELDEQIWLADEAGDAELGESLWLERRILADMRDDLRDPAFRQDFAVIRDVIEEITKGFE